jgi:hypothetical protein
MVASPYVLEVLCFVQKYKWNLKQTFEIHEHNMEVNMTCIYSFVIQLYLKKSVLNTGVKLYKHLPSKIK